MPKYHVRMMGEYDEVVDAANPAEARAAVELQVAQCPLTFDYEWVNVRELHSPS